MKTLLDFFLKTYRYQRRHLPKATGGFTMIELLVGMIIAALIITPMLAFVVDILNRDVREQAKTNSEQELQAAIDYIAQDISQAVYVYDEAGVGAIETELPYPPAEDAANEKEPILVFWKREFVEDALAFDGGICANPGTDSCNDTFVSSLVVYYLIDDDNATWCQPSGGTCPKRIARFQIQDGVKNLSGNYVCDGDGDGDGRSTECDTDALRRFQRDLGFRSLDRDNATGWTQASQDDGSGGTTQEGYGTNGATVLLNYIEGFSLDDPLADSNGDGNIDADDGGVRLIEVSGNKLAKIEIVGNALRRSQNDFSCIEDPATPTYKNSPYCPKATAQIGARSGFGTSE